MGQSKLGCVGNRLGIYPDEYSSELKDSPQIAPEVKNATTRLGGMVLVQRTIQRSGLLFT